MLPMKRQEHAHSPSLCMMSRPGSLLIRMPCVIAPTNALRGRPISEPTRRPERRCCPLPGYSYPKGRNTRPRAAANPTQQLSPSLVPTITFHPSSSKACPSTTCPVDGFHTQPSSSRTACARSAAAERLITLSFASSSLHA